MKNEKHIAASLIQGYYHEKEPCLLLGADFESIDRQIREDHRLAADAPLTTDDGEYWLENDGSYRQDAFISMETFEKCDIEPDHEDYGIETRFNDNGEPVADIRHCLNCFDAKIIAMLPGENIKKLLDIKPGECSILSADFFDYKIY